MLLNYLFTLFFLLYYWNCKLLKWLYYICIIGHRPAQEVWSYLDTAGYRPVSGCLDPHRWLLRSEARDWCSCASSSDSPAHRDCCTLTTPSTSTSRRSLQTETPARWMMSHSLSKHRHCHWDSIKQCHANQEAEERDVTVAVMSSRADPETTHLKQ